MKLDLGQTSFYTFGLLLACVIYFVKSGMRFELYQIILTALLVVTTLIGKLLQSNSFANSYFFFLVMLLLFPSLTRGGRYLSSFWSLTVFFSLGIITAALSAQQVAGYANISRYIRVDSYLAITRLSGYYGDPNFYSAHITACLAGVMLLLNREQERKRQLFLVFDMILLAYCGLLSASKAFAVVIACEGLVWIVLLLRRSDRVACRRTRKGKKEDENEEDRE